MVRSLRDEESGKQNKIAFLLLFDASTHFPTHFFSLFLFFWIYAQLWYLFSNYIINLMICDRFLIGFLLLENIRYGKRSNNICCRMFMSVEKKNKEEEDKTRR